MAYHLSLIHISRLRHRFKYAELMPLYEQDNAHKEYGRDYILFSVYLLLATMAKPSFTIVLDVYKRQVV